MNTVTPVIIPTYIHSESEKCPSCGKTENKIEVCANCGYQYEDDWDELTFFEKGLAVLLFVFFSMIALWFIWTLVTWLGSYTPTTLLDVLKGQWEWLKSIRIY